MNIDAPIVVAYGGGLNSTAMLVGMAKKEIKPDLILMADTGGEKPETKRFVSHMAAWVRRTWDMDIIVVTKTGIDATLEDECERKSMLPSLAYGFKSCSLKWKVAPQDKYVNNWKPAKDAWAAGDRVTKVIGYDADEDRRAKIHTDNKYDYWYPLIEWQWGRDECAQAVVDAGLPTPPKSSCFFCPAMKPKEILALRDSHPDLFARAIAMESNANLTTVKGLGRRFSWASVASADEDQMRLFADSFADEEPCGCYDGDHDGIHKTVVELTTSAGCNNKKRFTDDSKTQPPAKEGQE
jgi:hypothetical protein